jgi:hypothetical protein
MTNKSTIRLTFPFENSNDLPIQKEEAPRDASSLYGNLLKLLDKRFDLFQAAAAMGAGTGGLLYRLDGGISGLNSGLDVTNCDTAAEAYSLL